MKSTTKISPAELPSVQLKCIGENDLECSQAHLQGCPEFAHFVAKLADQIFEKAASFQDDDERWAVCLRRGSKRTDQDQKPYEPARQNEASDLLAESVSTETETLARSANEDMNVSACTNEEAQPAYEVTPFASEGVGAPDQTLVVEESWWDSFGGWITDPAIHDGTSALWLAIRAQTTSSSNRQQRSGGWCTPGAHGRPRATLNVGGPTKPENVPYLQADFDDAVQSQRHVVSSVLRPSAQTGRVDDVMGLLVGDLWRSLGRWWDSGLTRNRQRPTLGAWANGVARFTAREWLRQENPLRAPQGQRMILLDALPGDALVEDRDAHVTDSTAADILKALRAQVLGQPGGASKWERMVRDVTHPGRGVRVRDELRHLLHRMNDADLPTLEHKNLDPARSEHTDGRSS